MVGEDEGADNPREAAWLEAVGREVDNRPVQWTTCRCTKYKISYG